MTAAWRHLQLTIALQLLGAQNDPWVAFQRQPTASVTVVFDVGIKLTIVLVSHCRLEL